MDRFNEIRSAFQYQVSEDEILDIVLIVERIRDTVIETPPTDKILYDIVSLFLLVKNNRLFYENPLDEKQISDAIELHWRQEEIFAKKDIKRLLPIVVDGMLEILNSQENSPSFQTSYETDFENMDKKALIKRFSYGLGSWGGTAKTVCDNYVKELRISPSLTKKSVFKRIIWFYKRSNEFGLHSSWDIGSKTVDIIISLSDDSLLLFTFIICLINHYDPDLKLIPFYELVFWDPVNREVTLQIIYDNVISTCPDEIDRSFDEYENDIKECLEAGDFSFIFDRFKH